MWNQLLLQLNFQKVHQYTGGKWLLHGIKHFKNKQLQLHNQDCIVSESRNSMFDRKSHASKYSS